MVDQLSALSRNDDRCAKCEGRGVVWEYTDPSLFNFFSPYISGAQRLANGNTLICEGVQGRLFEVTPAREVVWNTSTRTFSTKPAAPASITGCSALFAIRPPKSPPPAAPDRGAFATTHRLHQVVMFAAVIQSKQNRHTGAPNRGQSCCHQHLTFSGNPGFERASKRRQNHGTVALLLNTDRG